MSTLERLAGEALELGVHERIALIESLLGSLDKALSPPALSDDWHREIARRADELASGAVKAVPWEVVRRQLFEGLDARAQA